eukprot:scaffold11601_cov31-Tisochrysis_lutea.AAC.2
MRPGRGDSSILPLQFTPCKLFGVSSPITADLMIGEVAPSHLACAPRIGWSTPSDFTVGGVPTPHFVRGL